MLGFLKREIWLMPISHVLFSTAVALDFPTTCTRQQWDAHMPLHRSLDSQRPSLKVPVVRANPRAPMWKHSPISTGGMEPQSMEAQPMSKEYLEELEPGDIHAC